MEFEQWLKMGIDNDWCGPPICETHDGFPMSDEEMFEYDEHGEPPCMHMIRLYEDTEHKTQVEKSHSPTQWRRTNRGM